MICLECSLSQNCQHVYTSRHNSNDTTRPIGTQGAAYRPYECADTDDTPPPWMSAATHPTSTSVWGGARMDLPDAITNSEVTMQPRWQSPASPRRSTPSRVNETPVRCSYLMQVSCAACAGSTTTRARQHTCACEHSLLSISTRSNRPATRKVAQKNRKKEEKAEKSRKKFPVHFRLTTTTTTSEFTRNQPKAHQPRVVCNPWPDTPRY